MHLCKVGNCLFVIFKKNQKVDQRKNTISEIRINKKNVLKKHYSLKTIIFLELNILILILLLQIIIIIYLFIFFQYMSHSSLEKLQ